MTFLPKDTPRAAPAVCGALGDFDRDRVRAIAAAFGGSLRSVHEDVASILLLDREPLLWGGGRKCGFGWIEGDIWRPRIAPAEWREAARQGACGLAIDGGRRFLHSAVNGLAPIYWIEDGKAMYFASQIDPLVRSSPRPLSIDWDAWASIFVLRYPLGDRTPFAEVRRLGPFSTLRRRIGRTRVQAHRWPWAEIEPHLDLEAGTEAVTAALGRSLGKLDGNIICPLSGGRDSRLLLSILVASGRASLTAVTVSDDEGAPFEEELAAGVAAALDVRHERLGSRVEDYPADWEERARRVEYQFVDHAWLVPLARRIAGAGSPVLDGFALDTLMEASAGFHTPKILDLSDPRASSTALFSSLRQHGQAHLAFAEQFHRPILERSYEQFISMAKRFEGHPLQPTLELYASRTVRGIASYPSGLLGRSAQVFVPGSQDDVVSAILAVPSTAKDAAGLQSTVQRRVNPRIAALPSTRDTPRAEPHRPRRWRSAPAISMHRDRLAAGPLTEHLSSELRAWLDDPSGELSPDLRLGLEAASLLHAWWARYNNYVKDVDATNLIA